MHNLFVCHSQAHITLAVGLAKGRFKADSNHFILFQDFALQENIKEAILDTFDAVMIRTGIYPDINATWKAKIKRYPQDIKAINGFMNQEYKKVFVVCDGNIPELYILKKALKLNKSVEMIWLEDGSYPYYQNIIANDGLNANSFTRLLRKVFFRYILNLGSIYDFEGNFMGGNKNLKQAYITFKGYERSLFKNKEIVAIEKNEYLLGLTTLFKAPENLIKDNSILLVLDKLDTYLNITSVKKMIAELLKHALESNINFYYKYHPREEDALSELAGNNAITELKKHFAVEYYYSSAAGKDIKVVGIKSTGLQSAKMLNFNAISAAGVVGEADKDILGFYSKIGVHTPNSLEGLMSKI